MFLIASDGPHGRMSHISCARTLPLILLAHNTNRNPASRFDTISIAASCVGSKLFILSSRASTISKRKEGMFAVYTATKKCFACNRKGSTCTGNFSLFYAKWLFSTSEMSNTVEPLLTATSPQRPLFCPGGHLSTTATSPQRQRPLKGVPASKITSPQRPLNQRLTNGVNKTQFFFVADRL